jgi:hypothetical protein
VDDIEVIGEASSEDDAVKLARVFGPEVILMHEKCRDLTA